MQADFRLAKPEEKERLKGEEPTYPPNRFILVSHLNMHIDEEDRRLPSHFQLSDGSIMMLVGKSRVVDYKKHAPGSHAQRYADMFLYLPWENEEQFLGEARISEEACQKMWEEYGEAALNVKNQLKSMIKRSWLS